MHWTNKMLDAQATLLEVFEDAQDGGYLDIDKIFGALKDLDRDLIVSWRDRLDEILDLHSDVESITINYEDCIGDTDNEDNDDPEDVKNELLSTIGTLTDLIDEVS